MFRWYLLAEWRLGAWRWLALGIPFLLVGMLTLPDPVGGEQVPAELASGLLRWLTLMGWATSAARRDRELPRWPQRPWLPTLGTLLGVISGGLLLGLLAVATLIGAGDAMSLPALVADYVPWLLQMAPWVTLLTLMLGSATSPWAIVLLPFVASWLTPVLTQTPFVGWLPDQTGESFHVVNAVRSLLIGVGIIAIAANVGPRRTQAAAPTRCL